ncbi:hypothetical protein RAA17_13680 [Komagataeibacter rhaeticus]|nr:hypothetical protein [Komagataeibacter rhaeticus]
MSRQLLLRHGPLRIGLMLDRLGAGDRPAPAMARRMTSLIPFSARG